MKLKKYISVCFCVLFVMPLCGQEEDSTRILKEIPVLKQSDKFDGIAHIRSSVPAYSLSKIQLINLGVTDVGAALKYVPGVQIKDYGGIGGVKTISFRSIGSGHTSVLLDGNMIFNNQTGSLNLSSFELFGVKYIQFGTGQPTLKYNTPSAYINANTICIYSEIASFKPTMNLQFYSNNTSISSFEHGLLVSKPLFKNRGQIGFQGMLKHGEGDYKYIYPSLGNSNEYFRENSELMNLKLRSVFIYLWDQAKINLSASFNDNQQELPGAIILYNPSHDQELQNKDFRLALNHIYVKNKWYFNFNSLYQNNYTRYFDPTFLNSQGVVESEYWQQNLGGGLLAKYRLMKNNQDLFFGSDVFYSDVKSNELQSKPTRLQVNSVVGASKWLFNYHVRIEANLSSQIITDNYLLNGDLTKKNYFKLSPLIAFSYLPFKREVFRFRGFYKRAFRMPTFNDLYYNFIGNTNLNPEEGDLFDLGLSYQKKMNSSKIELTGDVYFNKIWNKIVAIPTKDLFNWSMQNIGIVEVKGIDVSLLYAITFDDFTLTLNTSHNFNRSEDVTDPGSSSYKNQIPYTPYYSSSNGILLKWKTWGLNSNLIYSGYRYSLNQNIYANYLAPFTDINIGISKSVLLNERHEFLLNIKAMNILNKNYEVIRSYPMPGRYYQLNLRYTLK